MIVYIHRNTILRFLIIITAVFLVMAFFTQRVIAQKKSGTKNGGVATVTMTKEMVNEKLFETRKTLETIPSSAEKDSPQGQLRSVLLAQITLYEKYLELITKADTLADQKYGIATRFKEAKAQLTTLLGKTSPQTPVKTDKIGLDRLNRSVELQREGVAALRNRVNEQRNRLESLPDMIVKTREQVDIAEKNSSLLEEQRKSATDDGEKKRFDVMIENETLEKQIALKSIKLLSEEVDLAADLEPVLNAELEFAEKELERMELSLELYSRAFEEQLARAQQIKDDSLTQKEKALAEAKNPVDRFLAEGETELSRSERNKGDLEQFVVGLERDAMDQDKKLMMEKEELAGFKELLKQPEASRRATARIKIALKQMKLRRRILNRPFRQDFSDIMNGYQDRRFTIEDTLFIINDQWQEDVEMLLPQLPLNEQNAFKIKTAELLTRYRSALQDEKSLLTKTISLGQQIQLSHLTRVDILNQLERFIRSRIIWLRNDKPIGMDLLKHIKRESFKVTRWVRKLVSSEMMLWVTNHLKRPITLFYGAILFLGLPALLFYTRQYLMGLIQRRIQWAASHHIRILDHLFVIFSALMSTILIPIYLLIFAQFISSSNLPIFLKPVFSQMVASAAYFLFFWFLSRSFFGHRGIAHVHFGMPGDASESLFNMLCIVLTCAIPFLVLRQVFLLPPFEFQAFPRVCFTLFELIAIGSIIWLVRPKSPFVHRMLIERTGGAIARYWPSLSAVLIILAVLIVMTDIAGYRYAAERITRSYIYSLITLFLLPLLYVCVNSILHSVARRKNLQSTEAPSAGDMEGENHFEGQMQRFVRVIFIVTAIILFAGYWGIDTQAFKTFDEWNVYHIRGMGDTLESVTVADLVRAILFIVGTIWILKALPGIYEFTIFPRLRFDEGMKYATLTISRYGLFVIGMLLTLSEIHLDLGRLGWLMTAVGVGLGFGLQEIVSNFVSGIILLVERPVQVGDTVTVGNMSGNVRRINIRATTILNFDRQEVILPNRSLITQEVTNWTRGDTINRLVIMIGVAYGSDIELVSDILMKIAMGDPDVLNDPKPSVIFMLHGESSLDFHLRVFIPSPELIMVVRNRLNTEINHAFEKHHIEIPFPQRDLHIKSGPFDKDTFFLNPVKEDIKS